MQTIKQENQTSKKATRKTIITKHGKTQHNKHIAIKTTTTKQTHTTINNNSNN